MELALLARAFQAEFIPVHMRALNLIAACLKKVTDEVNIEARSDGMIFRAASRAGDAFFSFHFRRAFFFRYEWRDSAPRSFAAVLKPDALFLATRSSRGVTQMIMTPQVRGDQLEMTFVVKHEEEAFKVHSFAMWQKQPQSVRRTRHTSTLVASPQIFEQWFNVFHPADDLRLTLTASALDIRLDQAERHWLHEGARPSTTETPAHMRKILKLEAAKFTSWATGDLDPSPDGSPASKSIAFGAQNMRFLLDFLSNDLFYNPSLSLSFSTSEQPVTFVFGGKLFSSGAGAGETYEFPLDVEVFISTIKFAGTEKPADEDDEPGVDEGEDDGGGDSTSARHSVAGTAASGGGGGGSGGGDGDRRIPRVKNEDEHGMPPRPPAPSSSASSTSSSSLRDATPAQPSSFSSGAMKSDPGLSRPSPASENRPEERTPAGRRSDAVPPRSEDTLSPGTSGRRGPREAARHVHSHTRATPVSETPESPAPALPRPPVAPLSALRPGSISQSPSVAPTDGAIITHRLPTAAPAAHSTLSPARPGASSGTSERKRTREPAAFAAESPLRAHAPPAATAAAASSTPSSSTAPAARREPQPLQRLESSADDAVPSSGEGDGAGDDGLAAYSRDPRRARVVDDFDFDADSDFTSHARARPGRGDGRGR